MKAKIFWILGCVVLLPITLLFAYIFFAKQSQEWKEIEFDASLRVTKFPVLIHHGLLPLTTLEPVARYLREQGVAAYNSQVSPANRIRIRSEKLAEQVNELLQKSQAPKINIIAHSLGGLDARFLISQLGYGDRIASLSTLSTPHHGAHVADLLLEKYYFFIPVVSNLVGALFIAGGSFENMDMQATCEDLKVEGFEERFNAKNPDDPRVYYQSWGADARDHLTFLLYPTWRVIKNADGDNDGLVSVGSAQWTNYRATLGADHFQEVGNKLALALSDRFDPFEFYFQVAKELASRGY